ncbi:hypothetical protein, partial [Halorubrum ezzemoulense]|uniref:hypothetical protein n=1 Tax=Halorubrum ezzemoulense TaxID=337243 RepID=UPI002330E852
LITGHQYIVVGDGGTTICQSRSGIAVVIDIKSNDESLDFKMCCLVLPPSDGYLRRSHGRIPSS